MTTSPSINHQAKTFHQGPAETKSALGGGRGRSRSTKGNKSGRTSAAIQQKPFKASLGRPRSSALRGASQSVKQKSDQG